MKRRTFLTGATTLGALSFAGWKAAGEVADAQPMAASEKPSAGSFKRPPNILLLLPDQWRFDWMSSNPNLPIQTPNLDRIARSGIRFTNTIVNCPLCAPSRACLASGMEYGKTGVDNNMADYPLAPPNPIPQGCGLVSFKEPPTFYSMLRDAGYHVLGCGKMDLAKVSSWWGIDGMWRLPALGFSAGINNACKTDQTRGYRLNNNQPGEPYLLFLNSRGLLEQHLDDYAKRAHGEYEATFPTPLPDDAYCDNWIAQNGLNLLDSAPKDKPWFLQVNWSGPHPPVDITSRMESGVRGRSMPGPNGKNNFDVPTNTKIRQNYTAMCENIDRTIGLFLDKLSSSGELDNTVIVFSSDHGEMLGDHGRWEKAVPYHPSASVPLIVSGPGIRQGVSSAALVNLIDLAATFLDYGGVHSSGKLDSRSLRPVLEGKTEQHRDVVVSALGGWQMMFDGQYKVIRGFDPSRPTWAVYSKEVPGLPSVVFDLAEDPGENTNLASAMPSRAQQLWDRLKANSCA